MTLCWLFHKWGKWKRIKVNLKPENLIIDKQSRICIVCGLEEFRDL